MAEAFGVGTGIVGVASLAIQLTDAIVQFGSDWKDAPHDMQLSIIELQALKAILERNTNVTDRLPFEDASRNRLLLLPSQSSRIEMTNHTTQLLGLCRAELERLLCELKKQTEGHRLGWERLRAAFLAKRVRQSIQDLHRRCDILDRHLLMENFRLNIEMLNTINDGNVTRYHQRLFEDNQEILCWLSGVDYTDKLNEYNSHHYPGTCQWFTQSNEFHFWVEGSNQKLLCWGVPGVGKTILMSAVVDQLITQFGNDNTIGIAYFYCDFRYSGQQSASLLLASVLKQLVQRVPFMLESVKALYSFHKSKGTYPSLDQISRTLAFVITFFSKVFIVVDALDECQSANGSGDLILSEVFKLQEKSNMSFLSFSRKWGNMEWFEGERSMEIRANVEDIKTLSRGRLTTFSSFKSLSQTRQNEIIYGIIDFSNGM